MKLAELLRSWIQVPAPGADVIISDMTLNSRAVKTGDLFVALNLGVEYIPQAIEQGAHAILIEGALHCDLDAEIPIIAIPNLQQQYGYIASAFYGEPSQHLHVVGITGTNGKTSISYYIASLFQKTKGRCGVIGTLGVGELGDMDSTGLTTPDAITVHKTLKQFLVSGIHYVAMEVSSHALDQGRVNGVVFHTAVFSNLTHDHLDYHGDMKHYGAAKQKLFTDFNVQQAIINADDDFGQSLLAQCENAISYSAQDNKADVTVRNILFSTHGIHAQLHSPWGTGELDLSLLGEFNLSNVLASIAAVAICDVPLSDILTTAKNMAAVPGRMQLFTQPDKPIVIVDYAHTPDALAKALQATKRHCRGKLWCVFGCGGNRDRAKRSEMAKAAEAYADAIIVTSDNPRHEDPSQIIADIVAGFVTAEPHIEVLRNKAIAYALDQASALDVVLVAGKGHEDYQQVGDEKRPFSDAEQVMRQLDSY